MVSRSCSPPAQHPSGRQRTRRLVPGRRGGESVHLRDSLEKYGVVPFEPYAPVAWSEGSVAWFADRPTIVFPQVRIPIRITGVAIKGADGWRIRADPFFVWHPDEPLLNG